MEKQSWLLASWPDRELSSLGLCVEFRSLEVHHPRELVPQLRIKAHPPRPPGHWLLGNVPEFLRAPLTYLEHAVDRYGDIVELKAGRQPAVIIRHPDHVQHVLQTNRSNYPKRTRVLDRLGLVLGQGLVNSEGELWRQQRRRIQPFFHAEHIEAYAETMIVEAQTMMESWEDVASSDGSLDLGAEMMRIAFRIVGKTLLGADMAAETTAAREACDVLEGQTNRRLFDLFAPPLWVPTAENRLFREAVEKLDRIVFRLIERARSDPHNPSGVVGALVEAAKTDSGLTDKLIRDEIVTLLLAGHENTGNALTWLWYLVAKHPEVHARLLGELSEVVGDRPPRASDLAALEYTRKVVDEALRMYPTSWMNLRTADRADDIGGYRIEPGSWMLISPYLIHRHPAFWPEPKRFDPERFSKERREDRHMFSYVPFGAGPRKCLGVHFALVEMVLVVASVAQRFQFQLAFDGDLVAEPFVSLTPKGGLRVRLSRN